MHAISLVVRVEDVDSCACCQCVCECVCQSVYVCVLWLFSLHAACQVAIVDGWAKNEDWVFVIVLGKKAHIRGAPTVCCLQCAAWKTCINRCVFLAAFFLSFSCFVFVFWAFRLSQKRKINQACDCSSSWVNNIENCEFKWIAAEPSRGCFEYAECFWRADVDKFFYILFK